MALAFLMTASSAMAGESVNFNIDDGEVTPSSNFATRVTVLGASIVDGGGDPMPVTLRLRVDGESIYPFGHYNEPFTSNVNDATSRTYVPWVTFDGDSGVRVKAKSWRTDGSLYMSVDSSSNSQQVLVLRDGDAVPNIPGFANQGNIADFVEDYIVDGHVSLGANEVIYLFELGTSDMSSPYADFQDLVVVVEFADSPEALTMSTDLEALFD